MRTSIRHLTAIGLAAALLTACSSSDDPFQSPGGGTGTPGTPGTPTAESVRMGSGTGVNFSQGTIAIGQTPLSAGGTTSLTVTFVNQNNVLFTGEVEVSFSSVCIAQGLASVTSPVTTSSGIASTTYVAQGCDGLDEVTATATPTGEVPQSATGEIEVLSPTLGSIEFVSATPTNIGLQGMGGLGQTETSTVVFRVKDTTGGPVPNANVGFTLSTTVGGISRAPQTGTTTGDGQVQTIVQAGSVPTPVRVTATIVGTTPPISTQSDALTISTGIPDANSLSLSVETFNPEAWDIDGVEDAFTIRLADRFNNPVPDGTVTNFRTEGGTIVASCPTAGGACAATWTSQAPRPADGRVQVMAYVLGEESFVDVNGNGVFDDGDSFTDLGEPFLDENESGTYDVGEPFIDTNSNGTRDGPNGFWNGALCKHSTLCDPDGELIHVAQQFPIVMSGSFTTITVLSADPYPMSTGSFAVQVEDARGQPPPSGTTITATASVGTILFDTREITSTNFDGPLVFTFPTSADDPPTGNNGSITIEVQTPNGPPAFVVHSVTDN